MVFFGLKKYKLKIKTIALTIIQILFSNRELLNKDKLSNSYSILIFSA